MGAVRSAAEAAWPVTEIAVEVMVEEEMSVVGFVHRIPRAAVRRA